MDYKSDFHLKFNDLFIIQKIFFIIKDPDNTKPFILSQKKIKK